MWNVECGMWNVECGCGCGMWSVNFGFGSFLLMEVVLENGFEK